jgi:PncC family amidohydrolase
VPPTDDELLDLAGRVGLQCGAAGITIGTVESCTGGLVAHLLTEIAGSSAYFRGGFVTYANEIKVALVGVPTSILEAHGAVSAQTAVAMAEGARQRLGVDVALAVTGIAGPSGGSPAKPVGLTYVAVADAEGHDVRRYLWTGDRHDNKRTSAAAALELLAERTAPPAPAAATAPAAPTPDAGPNPARGSA